jgi:hypothetical protein
MDHDAHVGELLRFCIGQKANDGITSDVFH